MKDIIYIIFAINCLMVGYHYEYIKKDSDIFTTLTVVIGMLILSFPCYVFMSLLIIIKYIFENLGITNFLNLIPLYLGMYDHLMDKDVINVLTEMANNINQKEKKTIADRSFVITHKKVIAYINRKNLAK